MVLVGFVCVLGAIGLLVAGLAQADSGFLTASIAASALGGIAVGVAAMQRGRAADLAAQPAEETDQLEAPGGASTADSTEKSGLGNAPGSAESGPSGETVETWAAPVESWQPAESASGWQPAESEEEADPLDEPAEEDVEMADVLSVIDLDVEVLVVDLRPRYHLTSCDHLRGRHSIGIPVNQARLDGFTPCSLCRPDATLATAARGA